MTDETDRIKEWSELYARLDEYLLDVWPGNQVDTESLRGWAIDLISSQMKAQMSPTIHEDSTRRLNHYQVSQLFSGLSSKSAFKAARSVSAAGLTPVSLNLVCKKTEAKAIVAVFGESLIRVAESSLSPELVKYAHLYRYATTRKRRLEILKKVTYAFDSDRWSEKHEVQARHNDKMIEVQNDGEHVTYSYSPWSVMPHVFGVFPDSPQRPNCMGMSILVSAWCRLAGMEFMHCGFIEGYHMHHWYRYEKLAQKVLAFCDQHNIGLRPYVKYCLEADLATANQLHSDTRSGESSEGHAFVCARLGGDEWIALDPWMNNTFLVDGENTSFAPSDAMGILNSQSSVHPGLTLLSSDCSMDDVWAHQTTALDALLLNMKAMSRELEGMRDTTAYPFGRMIVELAQTMLEQGLPEGYADDAMNWRLGIGYEAAISAEYEDCLNVVNQLLYDLYGFYSRIHDVSGVEAEVMLQRAIDRYDYDPYHAERMRTDLVGSLVTKLFDWSRDLINFESRKSLDRYAHVTFEYGQASMGVGLGALVHLMAWDDLAKTALRPTDLLRLSSSQLVWQEAVTALHYRYQQAGLDAARIAAALDDTGGPAAVTTFGELVLTDRQDWRDLLGSSGVDWLDPAELQLVREATQEILKIKPSQQHRQVRRLLARLQEEYDWAQQVSMTPMPEEAKHGKA